MIRQSISTCCDSLVGLFAVEASRPRGVGIAAVLADDSGEVAIRITQVKVRPAAAALVAVAVLARAGPDQK